MSCAATLRQSGGSIILSIPKTIAQSMAVEAGSVVELVVEGRKLSVTPARRSLADRLVSAPSLRHRGDAMTHRCTTIRSGVNCCESWHPGTR